MENRSASNESTDDYNIYDPRVKATQKGTVVKHADEYGHERTVTLTHGLTSDQYPTSDSKIDAGCEQFRQYLDETGIMTKLASTLEKIFEATEVANEVALENPRKYFLSIFGAKCKPKNELKSLKAEIIKLESTLDRIHDENTRLRAVLKLPEIPIMSSEDEDDYDIHDTMDNEDETPKSEDEVKMLKIYEELLQADEIARFTLISHQSTLFDGIHPPPFEEFKFPEENRLRHDLEDGLEHEFEGEEFEELNVQPAQLSTHFEVDDDDDYDDQTDLLMLSDTELDINYDESEVVDHFSDSDEKNKSSDSEFDDGGDYKFEDESSQSECVTDDSDIDSECQKLDESGVDYNLEDEFQDNEDDDDDDDQFYNTSTKK